ncbi:hypothetical protein [Colwellia sp. MB3u-4]|uniref:hypothetical protein n=1 Tax=Colwellia sp. MB3u-4 TaxID=2759822 RepID=UPI0015F3FB2E|nr:hypothetical protein [Colwellia sp. MB3u-4]MBA6287772.1 hypothetical protein [Colwellia sp. MB3u-4]
MTNQVSKEKIEEAFDNLCEQYDYSTDIDVYNDFIYLMQQHQIVFYELLHTPNINAVATFEQANELSSSVTKQQKLLLDFINEKKSCDELKALFFKLKNYIDEFYNLLTSEKSLELKAQLKNFGKNFEKKLEAVKFLEFEHIAEEIENKHQSLLRDMSKDNNFIKRNLSTNRFEIYFSKSKNKKWKGKNR